MSNALRLGDRSHPRIGSCAIGEICASETEQPSTAETAKTIRQVREVKHRISPRPLRLFFAFRAV